MLRTSTLHTSSSGFPITSSQHSVISRHAVVRWQLPSVATPLPSKSSSSVSVTTLAPCSSARPSCTDTRKRVWTRWSLLRPNRTCRIILLSINSTRSPGRNVCICFPFLLFSYLTSEEEGEYEEELPAEEEQ